MKRSQFRLSHVQVIALGFFLMIALGTGLLLLPWSVREGAATFTEALFTAASASCVTGLVLRDTYAFWSPFGQAVILVLIQLGGLGFMTISTFFFLALRRHTDLRQREILSESINSTQLGGILRLTRTIILGTAVTELSGAALLALVFCPALGFGPGLWAAVFTAVSAFCNAGFDLMGRYGPYSSLVPFSGNLLVNVTVMLLIVIGGLGFMTWEDMLRHGFRFRRYKLHSKLVLTASALLIVGGGVLFFLVEGAATGRDLPLGQRALTALFASVTARTAGFNTVDLASMSTAGKFLTVLLMFIGGSPGSTAGGVKTTTVAVLLVCAFSYVRGSRGNTLFGRRLESDALRKASTVFFTNLLLSLAAAFVICAIEPLDILDVLLETFSANATVGLSTGITRELGTLSRYLIIFLMYTGRIGSVSFASALTARKAPPPVSCPEESVTVG